MKITITRLFSALLILLALSVMGQSTIINHINKNGFESQEQCGSAIIHDKLMKHDPNYKTRMIQNEAIIQNIINSGNINRGTIYTIPVVVHVMHLGEAVGTGTNISVAQINSAIANLNTCYGGTAPYSNNIEVQF